MKLYEFDPGSLERVRGSIMQKLGRNVSYNEFARMAGVPAQTLARMRKGQSRGSTTTIRTIIDNLAQIGVIVTFDDFLKTRSTTQRPRRGRR